LALTLSGGNRLRIFENSVLRRILGHKRDKETKEWEKIRNEDFRIM
jgi:hypothetical protein